MKSHKSRVSDRNSEQKPLGAIPETELALEQNRFELTWLDYLTALMIAVLASLWIFPYVGTTVNWDDLFYMNLSQYTTPQACSQGKKDKILKNLLKNQSLLC